MVVPTSDLYDVAKGKYCLAAYSVNNLEQIRAVFEGNRRSEAPFILATSETARDYMNAALLEGILKAAGERFSDHIFAVHLDHGDRETCLEAIRSGVYSSVMIDASHRSFEENISVTREIVDEAHARGISVEAELGTLSGKEDDRSVTAEEAALTDPDRAREFVEWSGCDSLAVAVGTSHGAYKFEEGGTLDFERLSAIHERMPEVPLVLHGGSAVPRREVERVNAAGGELKPSAGGIHDSEYERAVRHGVVKVNIDTDSRLLWMRVYREFLRDRPGALDFRIPGRTFIEEYAALIVQRSRVLRSAGQLAALKDAVTE